MTQQQTSWVDQANEHWADLLRGIERAPSRSSFRQLGFGFWKRLLRSRPDELDFVCESLRDALDDALGDALGDSAKGQGEGSERAPSGGFEDPYRAAVAVVRGMFLELALRAQADARRKAGQEMLDQLLGTPKVAGALRAIGDAGSQTSKDLQRRLGLSASHVSQVLRPLKEAGLVEVRRDAGDGRVHHFMLTAAGEQALSHLPAAGSSPRLEHETNFARVLDFLPKGPPNKAPVNRAVQKLIDSTRHDGEPAESSAAELEPVLSH